MHPLGKSLIVLGGLLMLAGVLILAAGKVPFLGRLPGDINIRRPNFSFYFPLTTCLVISAILSLILALFGRK